jgi:hypothetical protein
VCGVVAILTHTSLSSSTMIGYHCWILCNIEDVHVMFTIDKTEPRSKVLSNRSKCYRWRFLLCVQFDGDTLTLQCPCLSSSLKSFEANTTYQIRTCAWAVLFLQSQKLCKNTYV